jgi:hypothetical protein
LRSISSSAPTFRNDTYQLVLMWYQVGLQRLAIDCLVHLNNKNQICLFDLVYSSDVVLFLSSQAIFDLLPRQNQSTRACSVINLKFYFPMDTEGSDQLEYRGQTPKQETACAPNSCKATDAASFFCTCLIL